MSVVRMATHNPYEDRFPGRRVITREQLHLMKLLRREGIVVEFDGDPDAELNYLALSGLHEWLSDPVVLTAIGIPLNIITGLIGSALYDLFKNKRASADNVVIQIDEQGSWIRYHSDGRRLSDRQLAKLSRALEKRYTISHAKVTPLDPRRPAPIYLEHTDRIVAWGRLVHDEVGLRVDDALIVDDEVRSRMERGELTGLSIGGLVRMAECSVCSQSIFDCEHIWGETYDGELCGISITKMDLGEVSLVEHPAQPLARAQMASRPSATA